mgnify:CR=1 FL=1
MINAFDLAVSYFVFFVYPQGQTTPCLLESRFLYVRGEDSVSQIYIVNNCPSEVILTVLLDDHTSAWACP